ncbi:MAG: hypothetical protein NZ953_03005 [Thaumarchaeota archaeon]|nr:hypothetical protein [Candidatus Calditenuaceae archaeon]MCX8203642.1 hypothetical protein [Nitrososphaeria archaeon]MDW8042863.1 hypothetical protein [Nitrososphaerota archaeon]
MEHEVQLSLSSALFGALYGAVFAGAGYLKSRRREEFSPEKFLRTVALGALVGLTSAHLGLELDDVRLDQMLLTGGTVTLLNDLLSAMLASRRGLRR